MKLISHRGNLFGRDKKLENDIKHIERALSLGFDVEIDVRMFNGNLYLGHDFACNQISKYFLLNERLWCHAKDIDALNVLLNIGAHCFWHQNDLFTLTSKNYIWEYPCKNYSNNSIAVLPELNNVKLNQLKQCNGICSDFIGNYKGE